MSPETAPFPGRTVRSGRRGHPRHPGRRGITAARGMLLFAALLAGQIAVSDTPPDAQVQSLLNVPIAELGHRELDMLTVEYPPGGSSKPHRHDAYVMVYVLSGAIDMQVTGQPLAHLTAGQTFLERPNDVHEVSRNASQTEPAKFLVVMLKKAPRATSK